MELKIRHSLFVKIANEQKKSTSRLGERDVKVGDKLIFRSTDDENFAYETTVTDVKVCKFSDITEEDAKMEGYVSLEEMTTSLKSVYEFDENSVFTLIKFK